MSEKCFATALGNSLITSWSYVSWNESNTSVAELRASTSREETIGGCALARATRQFGRATNASQLDLEQVTAREQTHVMSDAHMEIDDVDQANNDTPPPPEDKPSDQPKGKATAKPTASLVREPGKSLLPISRVQKIMKADKVRVRHHICKAPSLTSF
jgi:hypothetical protein